MKRTIPILLLVLALTSCHTTHTATREDSASRDTLLRYVTRIDTFLTRDSIFTDRYTKGDTIFVTKYRERTHTRIQLRTDTLYQTHRDTLRVSVEKVVTKKPSLWERILRDIPLAIIMFVCGAAIALVKRSK